MISGATPVAERTPLRAVCSTRARGGPPDGNEPPRGCLCCALRAAVCPPWAGHNPPQEARHEPILRVYGADLEWFVMIDLENSAPPEAVFRDWVRIDALGRPCPHGLEPPGGCEVCALVGALLRGEAFADAAAELEEQKPGRTERDWCRVIASAFGYLAARVLAATDGPADQ